MARRQPQGSANHFQRTAACPQMRLATPVGRPLCRSLREASGAGGPGVDARQAIGSWCVSLDRICSTRPPALTHVSRLTRLPPPTAAAYPTRTVRSGESVDATMRLGKGNARQLTEQQDVPAPPLCGRKFLVQPSKGPVSIGWPRHCPRSRGRGRPRSTTAAASVTPIWQSATACSSAAGSNGSTASGRKATGPAAWVPTGPYGPD